MSADTTEKIMRSLFPKIAAEARWNDEQRYGSKEGLQRRLREMTDAGIISEVLDLIEALEMPIEEATPALITTYEKAAQSTEIFSIHRKEQGDTKLAELDERQAQIDRNHATALRDGTTTIAKELEARAEERIGSGFPDNFYKTLLSNPVFPK